MRKNLLVNNSKSYIIWNFLIHPLRNIILSCPCFWTQSLLVPCVISCLRCPIIHSTFQKLIVCRRILFETITPSLFIPLFINKKCFYLFLFVLWYPHQSHLLVGRHAAVINFLLNSFVNASRCLCLLHQATSFTWIIVSRSLSSKWSSLSLILLTFIKVYINIREYNIIKYFKLFTCNKSTRNKL